MLNDAVEIKTHQFFKLLLPSFGYSVRIMAIVTGVAIGVVISITAAFLSTYNSLGPFLSELASTRHFHSTHWIFSSFSDRSLQIIEMIVGKRHQ